MASPSSKEEKLEHFHDTLAIITQLGQPDYLVSFYCNENWKEITADLRPGQTPADRPDILCKVFHSKYKDLLEDIKKNHCLGGGSNVAYFSEIEFVVFLLSSDAMFSINQFSFIRQIKEIQLLISLSSWTKRITNLGTLRV